MRLFKIWIIMVLMIIGVFVLVLCVLVNWLIVD